VTREYNFPTKHLMSDDDLNAASNNRYKRLRSLEWIVYGVSGVAWTVFGAAMWNPGAYWDRSSRHSLMVGSWLVFAVLGLCRLMIMRRRSEMSPLRSPSGLSTLGLSEPLAGQITSVRAEHSKIE
jgi:hypothetical protein